MRLNPSLVVIAPKAQSAYDSSHYKLRGQDGIDYNMYKVSHCRSFPVKGGSVPLGVEAHLCE